MAEQDETDRGVVGQRSCVGCTMCCKLLAIAALEKPRLQWCQHCDVGVGCKIYDERPSECRAFECGYVVDEHIGDHWRPAESRMVVSLATDARRMVIYVDPDRPDAWRKEPFYSDIKNWSRAAERNQGQIMVAQGLNMIAVTPDGETDLGPVRDDQLVITRRVRGADGISFQHIVVDQDDPVLEAIRLLQSKELAEKATPDRLAEARRQVDAWLAEERN